MDDYSNLIVTYKNGAPVRLSDIAQVVDGAENLRLAAWADDTPAIIVNVQRQPGANVIRHGRRHQEAACRNCRPALPASLEVRVLTDRTTGIRASVEHVQMELVLSVLLVVLVIFCVPAQLAGHGHRQPVGAHFPDRHLRRHVHAGLQPEQPVA